MIVIRDFSEPDGTRLIGHKELTSVGLPFALSMNRAALVRLKVRQSGFSLGQACLRGCFFVRLPSTSRGSYGNTDNDGGKTREDERGVRQADTRNYFYSTGIRRFWD